MQEFPRLPCRQSFVTWKRVAFCLASLLLLFVGGAGTGATIGTNMQRDIRDNCRDIEEIKSFVADIKQFALDADTVKLELRKLRADLRFR
jgi:accessory colonization factor AcfC